MQIQKILRQYCERRVDRDQTKTRFMVLIEVYCVRPWEYEKERETRLATSYRLYTNLITRCLISDRSYLEMSRTCSDFPGQVPERRRCKHVKAC